MKALGARAIPIPGGIDTFHLKEEVEPSDTMTALDAVMSVDEERERLEKEAEDLNTALTSLTEAAERGETSFGGDDDDKMTMDEKQELLMEMLTATYERLDDLDADTAETRVSMRDDMHMCSVTAMIMCPQHVLQLCFRVGKVNSAGFRVYSCNAIEIDQGLFGRMANASVTCTCFVHSADIALVG